MLLGIATTTLLMACGSKSEKDVKLANESYTEGNNDLKDAVKDQAAESKAQSKEDWRLFKNEADSLIANMEEKVKELEDKMARADKKEKQRLKIELNNTEALLKADKAKLQKRNAEFELEIDRFDDSMKTKNETFKREFKQDLKELEVAFTDLFKDKKK
jgi:hypothetical protein